MLDMTKIQIGRYTAIASFILGSVIFLSYVISDNSQLLFIGYFFIIAVGIVNLFILLWLMCQTSEDQEIRKGLTRSKLLIVANIPIAIGYFFAVIYLLSYLRITFTNKTGEVITNIRIVGCDKKSINQLKPHEAVTKWIGINGDCSVYVKYIANGHENHEVAVGYASGLMGQRLKYDIGSNIEAIQ